MKAIEKQKENVNTLLNLIKENPELEIVPMVDAEVVGDDSYSSWAGTWGDARVDEYYCGDERIYFRSKNHDELVDEQIDILDDEETDADNAELEAVNRVNNLPWVKCIAVNIGCR